MIILGQSRGVYAKFPFRKGKYTALVMTRVCLLLLLAGCASAEMFRGMPLAYRTDFSSADDWEPTDPSAWRVTEDGAYDLHKKSKYRPPQRSPYNVSLLKGVRVGDFILDVRLRSTHKDYNHRDLCLFFGWQDPEHFYYVHLGKRADDHANSVFLVDGKPRVSIADWRTDGTPWTDDWHRARVIRRGAQIEVYFDDMDTPAMTAQSDRFGAGRVGLGSFDDKGRFDDFALWGVLQTP